LWRPAVARGTARCASQVLEGGAQAVARGAARCASQVLDRGAQAVARGAATLSQQEKNNSADVHQNKANFTGFAGLIRLAMVELKTIATRQNHVRLRRLSNDLSCFAYLNAVLKS
jgi:hypothetical protein